MKKKFEDLDAKLVPELEKLDADIAAASSAGKEDFSMHSCAVACPLHHLIIIIVNVYILTPFAGLKAFMEAHKRFAEATVKLFEESLAATESSAAVAVAEAAAAPAASAPVAEAPKPETPA